MSYLQETYNQMGLSLDPKEDYFELDSRFLTIEKTLIGLPGGQLCDLGCGRGAVIRRLSKHHQVYGTEYDPNLVALGKADGLEIESLDLNEATTLPFGEVMFDYMLISEVCEHLLDPRNALRLAYSRLKPGGMLVVTVPNAVPLLVRLRVLFGQSTPWLHYPSADTETTGHIRFFTISTLTHLLREIGFTISDIRGVSFRMNGKFWARLCFVCACFSKLQKAHAATLIDVWLGRIFPGLAPGLFVVARKPANDQQP